MSLTVPETIPVSSVLHEPVRLWVAIAGFTVARRLAYESQRCQVLGHLKEGCIELAERTVVDPSEYVVIQEFRWFLSPSEPCALETKLLVPIAIDPMSQYGPNGIVFRPASYPVRAVVRS